MLEGLLLLFAFIVACTAQFDSCLRIDDVHEQLSECNAKWRDCEVPNVFGDSYDPCHVFSLTSLFNRSEMTDILAALQANADWSTRPCSTDQKPSYETYLVSSGNASQAMRLGVWERISSRLECVTALVRTKFNCTACVPCTSLVRRYRSAERTEVPAHRDSQAAVTLVVELQGSTRGGFYVKANQQDQPSFADMAAGDAILHDFKLLHGVQVGCDEPDCVRYSFITWFQKHQYACEAGDRWVSSSREAQIDRGFKMFLQTAHARFGKVKSKLAREVYEAHASRSGGVSMEKFDLALGALGKGSEWIKSRREEINNFLDRFIEAARRSLKVSLGRSAARRALTRHADEHGKLDKERFFGALSMLREEL